MNSASLSNMLDRTLVDLFRAVVGFRQKTLHQQTEFLRQKMQLELSVKAALSEGAFGESKQKEGQFNPPALTLCSCRFQ